MRAQELEKHNRYVMHEDGRTCTNKKLYVAVVNTYGKVGQELVDFSAVVDKAVAVRVAAEISRICCLCSESMQTLR